MLLRRFTPMHMLFLSINGIIGSAWLFAPMYVAKIAGSAAIISWLIGGAATLLIAFTFAELSTLLPAAGGSTRFAELTQGSTAGFIISWVSWISCVTMPPIEVQAVLLYLSTYIPSLVTVSGHVMPVLSPMGLCWAVVLMLGLTFLNIASFKGFIQANFFIFSFKILVIALTILWLMTTKFHPLNFNIMGEGVHSLNWEAILSAVATGGIAFAFTGFKHGVELAGEMTNPKVSIPLAIIGSVIGCLILYLGLQIAFIGALDPAQLANGWGNLHFNGDVGPFVGIAAALGLAWLVKLLLIDAAVSPLGAGLIYVTSTARIIYAMSRNGYLSPLFAKINKQKMPLYAIWLNFAVGILLFLPLPGWQNMVSFLVSAVVISYAMGPIATMCLRKQLPNEHRSFRLPFNTVLCFVAFYCCNLISFWTGWDTMWKLAIAIAIGVVFFLSTARLRVGKDLRLKALYWIVPYILGLIVLSYLGEYGHGRNVITFGWDFLCIAIFSLVIFSVAIYVRQEHTIVEKEFARLKLEIAS